MIKLLVGGYLNQKDLKQEKGVNIKV